VLAIGISIGCRRSYEPEQPSERAEVLVPTAPGSLALLEDAVLDRALQPGGLVLLKDVEIIEAPQEQPVGDLLDDLEEAGRDFLVLELIEGRA